MNLRLQIALIVGVVLYFFVLFYLLRKSKLNLRYTLLWLVSGVLLLVAAVFPNLVTRLSSIIGIIDPTNAIYLMILACVIIILISITSIVSGLNDRVKSLIQIVSIQDKKIVELQEKIKTEKSE